MVPGCGVRRARGHQLVRPAVPAEQRDAVRGVLSVRRGTGTCLSEARRCHPVPGLLRGSIVGHSVLLRHDGTAPHQQHQKHARRGPGECRWVGYRNAETEKMKSSCHFWPIATDTFSII